ncbi:6-phosphofructokinase [candidate division KSB1 bacterium]|nr:6-phosphofructokinase [candidate division KSB1 bacterium]RQW09091.1 MAG: 6-phosphofructokinase [candidate division KSB1 bacterium]
MSTPHKVAILTSGGDSPGMNGAIRAIVRTAIYHELEVIGFKYGYQGILDANSIEMNARSVSGILQRGGTILGSSRCERFMQESGQRQAATVLQELGVDVLFVIGGNGSMRGAYELMKYWDGQVIGLPGTIDNDCGGTDFTIGFFTALDTALESIDKIRDTAEAFNRVFVVEVMGRKAGDIALGVGITGGAEEMLLPEKPCDLDQVVERMVLSKERGKGSYIIVVAEGAYEGGAPRLAEELEKRTGYNCRPVVLSHIQRGGSPVAMDRWFATRMGAFAVKVALQGANGVMVGIVKNELVTSPLEKTWQEKKAFDPFLFEIQPMLSI